MTRFILTLLAGAVLALIGQSLLVKSQPHPPTIIEKAASTLGMKAPVPVPLTPASYAATGPLSASIQAETNRKYDDALKEVIAYQKSGGDPFMVAMRSGWLYLLKSSYPEAEQAYMNANRLHVSAINPLLGLLSVGQAMKDENRIRRAAEALIKVEPSNYRANMALGGLCFAARDYRGAAFAYRRILSCYPDDVDARSGMAWAEYYTGDSQDALVQFEAILGMYPDYPYAKQGYGLAGASNGKPALR